MKTTASSSVRFLLVFALIFSVFTACEKATSVTDPSGNGSSGGSSSGGSSSGGSSNSGGSSSGGSTSGTYFTCDINGHAWSGTTIAGIDGKSLGGIFNLTGTTGSSASNSTTLSLMFMDTVKTGSVAAFDGFGTNLAYADIPTGTAYAVSDLVTPSGAITITSINTSNHTISGTFSQTTLYNSQNSNDSITVTNGKFSMSYSIQ
jgi:hypothetical protein